MLIIIAGLVGTAVWLLLRIARGVESLVETFKPEPVEPAVSLGLTVGPPEEQ
jgi:uncharacterized membrane protein